jgi:predicted nuclease of restriction endonuclease-like (RecB) superfamily
MVSDAWPKNSCASTGFVRAHQGDPRRRRLSNVRVERRPLAVVCGLGSFASSSGGTSCSRELGAVASHFRLSWTHYALLIRTCSPRAREFYETEALRDGWTVRQLRRQIDSQFYERTALSRNKAAMLRKGSVAKPEDAVTPEEEIKSPYVLEFLGLKDEYSESDLEGALISRLESFLHELGDDFTFVGRQRRLRLDDVWYRVDLLFFHRTLRRLVVIDLKLGKLSHADVGQMHLYLDYAREHWARAGENPPVGLILCVNLPRFGGHRSRCGVLARQ